MERDEHLDDVLYGRVDSYKRYNVCIYRSTWIPSSSIDVYAQRLYYTHILSYIFTKFYSSLY